MIACLANKEKFREDILSNRSYTAAKKWIPQRWADPLLFTYETTGVETNFRDQRDPVSRSRPVFAFHRPEADH